MAAPFRTAAAAVAAVHVADLDLSDSDDAPSSASAAAEQEVPNYALRSAALRAATTAFAAVKVADLDLSDSDNGANVGTVARGATSASAQAGAPATTAPPRVLARVLSNDDLGSLIIEFASWAETPHLANLQAVSSDWRRHTRAHSKLAGTCRACSVHDTVASRCAGTRKKCCQKSICYQCCHSHKIGNVLENVLSACQGCRKRLACHKHLWFCSSCDELR